MLWLIIHIGLFISDFTYWQDKISQISPVTVTDANATMLQMLPHLKMTMQQMFFSGAKATLES